MTCCDEAPHICELCNRVMSHREWSEQHLCDDCVSEVAQYVDYDYE